MPSEYDIYRAYAGMNRSKSGFDTFMEGLKEIQAGARADRQLDLQERSQNRADEAMKFNQQQAIANKERQARAEEDNEFKMMIQYAQNPAQRAMIARSRGKEELALGFDEKAKELENANDIYKRMYSGSEEEMLSAATEILSKIPINSNTEGMHKVAAQRQNAMFESIKDTDEEILSSKYATEYSGYIKKLNDPYATEADKTEGMSGIESVRDRYRIDEQERVRSLTKMPTSIPQVEKDINEELGDYIINDNVGSSLIAGNFLGGEQPSFPVYADELEKQRVVSGDQGKVKDKIQYTSAKPLKEGSSVQDYIDAYKGKGEEEIASRMSATGAIVSEWEAASPIPVAERKKGKVSDRYKTYAGLEEQLNSASRGLLNLERTRGGVGVAGVSEKEWGKKYREESSVYKKSLQDMYNLYLQLEEDKPKSKSKLQKAGSIRGKQASANNWFKNNLKSKLIEEKKRLRGAGSSFYEVYNIDPEIKEILDSIQL